MEFEAFAERAAAVEAASADTEIVDLVREILAAADEDLAVVTRFVQGRVFPAWDSTTLDVGPQYCYAAIARAAGPNVDAADVEDRLADLGEIGEVAAEYDFGGQRGLSAFTEGTDQTLTVAEVYDQFQRIAEAEGAGSQDTKQDLLFGLLTDASSLEARYLVRLVLSEMRIGVGEGTVRDAIAAAFDVPVDAVERALQVSNDYGLVAETARESGVEGLSGIRLEVGRPVKAMLAQAGTVTDALEEFDRVAVETKFDGARVQVHADGEDVRVFSRNMEEVTDALPEVVEFVADHLRAPAILDGEVLAVDDDGDPLPFQEVLRRFRRKHDVAATREEVTVEFRAFDCLHAGSSGDDAGPGGDGSTPAGDSDPATDAGDAAGDGNGSKDLLDEPLLERRRRLRSVLAARVVDQTVTDDPDDIEAIERDALAAGHEGILLKDPDSSYVPGRRGKHWLKRKPDVETLDLVVVGAEWGEGRRANLLGTFLVAARTDEGYEPVGKVATGITDDQLAELTDLIEPHVTAESGREVAVDPAVVFEVGYEEIQESTSYDSGYALRFPRFVSVRHDVGPGSADSLERIDRLAGE